MKKAVEADDDCGGHRTDQEQDFERQYFLSQSTSFSVVVFLATIWNLLSNGFVVD
jgi:hypothetical protein